LGTNYFIDGKIYNGSWEKDKMSGKGQSLDRSSVLRGVAAQ